MRRRRPPAPPAPPLELRRFRLPDWLPAEPAGRFEDIAVAAIRRWQAARTAAGLP